MIPTILHLESIFNSTHESLDDDDLMMQPTETETETDPASPHLFCLSLYACLPPHPVCLLLQITKTQGVMRSSQNHNIQNTPHKEKKEKFLHQYLSRSACLFVVCFFRSCSYQVSMIVLYKSRSLLSITVRWNSSTCIILSFYVVLFCPSNES